MQKYITEPHYKLWTGPVVVNVDWLRSLPADVQQAIIEAGHETTVEMRALLDKQESASREFLKEKGMVFCGVPTDEDECGPSASGPSSIPRSRTLKSLRPS